MKRVSMEWGDNGSTYVDVCNGFNGVRLGR